MEDQLAHLGETDTIGMLMSPKIYRAKDDFFSLSESSEDTTGKPCRTRVLLDEQEANQQRQPLTESKSGVNIQIDSGKQAYAEISEAQEEMESGEKTKDNQHGALYASDSSDVLKINKGQPN